MTLATDMKVLYQLRALRFAYGDHEILNIQDSCIERNTSTAILGINGSGKSTLLNLLAFLEQPTSGQLEFKQVAVQADQLQACRKRIAYVQQKPYLFDRSVTENIILPLQLRGIDAVIANQRVAALMQQLNISHLAQRPAREISGGEVQKVALARAMITEPEVLLLDEPFTHLDRATTEFLEEFLLDLKQTGQVSLIFTIHDQLKAHYLADQVFSLLEGRLVPSDSLNLMHGEVDTARSVFVSKRMEIVVPCNIEAARHIALDPKQLVLSRERLDSSMRNQFQGRITGMQEYRDEVRISLDAGEVLHAVITHAALKELAVTPGDSVWISFKSSSLSFF